MNDLSLKLKFEFRQAFSVFSFLILILACAASSSAQTATNIQVTNAVTQNGVHRFGVNLGDETYWDSGQMMKNLIFENPGFEGLKFRTILKCAHIASTDSCQDDNQYSRQPTGFWKGGTYEVLSGANAGLTGIVVQSTQNLAGCSGCGQTVQFDQSINAAVGDYFAVSQSFPGTGDAGWWDNVSGGGTITTETNDISPNSPGKQALLLSAPGSTAVTVAQYFESYKALSFIQMNGTFKLSFRAKGMGGNNQLSLNVLRLMGTNAPYLNQTVTLTNAWKDYTLTFSANETGSAVGTVQMVVGVAGGSAEIDDFDLEQTNSDPANTSVFRDDVVNALKQLKPGTIRMMAGAALGSDIPNQLAPPFARYRSSFSSTKTSVSNVAYGIDEFIRLCSLVGAEPWITIPTSTTPDEMEDLILYMTGTGGDSWSASRIARGQTKPWTTVFNKIHIELGNETWNGDFKGETMAYPGYPQWANNVFGTARRTTGFDPTKFDLVLDGWAAVPGYNYGLLSTATQQDSIDIAPYLLYSANNEAQSTMFGALLAEPEMLESPGGDVYQDVQMAVNAPTQTDISVYETNLGTMIGGITQAQLDQLTPSVGAGIAHTVHMMMMQRLGVKYQNAFALQQYQYLRSDQSNVRLWGMVVDMGTTNRRRPQFLTQALANTVAAGNMLTTTHSGANPTWNQPLSSDSVQLNGAHYLQSFAYLNGNAASTVVFNLSQTTALPVTFSGENAPTGSVQMSQITSAKITDNNEFANNVQTVTKTLSSFNPATGLTLPPFSMTVLNWTATNTQSPQFSVAAGTYSTIQSVSLFDTTAGATIYYTTDGSTPTTSSTKYTSAITVGKSQTLKAIAVAANYAVSPVASAAYVIQPVAPAPVFSLPTGTYTSGQTVTITDAIPGLTIYYTTDGSTPTNSSKVYTGTISVAVNGTLNAMAGGTNYTNSAVTTATYTIAPPTPTPTLSIAAGTYTGSQNVQISDSLLTSRIYYTTDGSTPTTSSTVYTTSVLISNTATLRAIAVAPGYSASGVASASYVIARRVVLPVLSVVGGVYNKPQTVAITTTTPNATIYYTIDGGTPTTSSNVYTGPLTISTAHYLQANALAPNSTVSFTATANYVMTVGTPVLSIAGGTYSGPQTITVSGVTPDASYFYTTNGTTPTTGSNVYVGPITLSGSQTLKVIGARPGYANSAVTTAIYSIGTAVASPVFTILPGIFSLPQLVGLSDATVGAKIYYTTNGSTPTTSSNLYLLPFLVSSSTTVKAIAVASGLANSSVLTGLFTISPTAATPTFSLAGGSYTGSQSVTIADASSGVSIYYTTDGTTPTAASNLYTGAIAVNGTETIKAIAIGTGYNPSAVASAAYTINAPSNSTTVVSAPSGFTSGLMNLNGSAKLVGSTLQLTNGGIGQAAAAWYPTKVDVSGFTTGFDFQLPSSDADGFTVTFQNASKGIYAVGGNGGALGYQGITKSATVAFNFYQSGVTDAQSIGVYTGGKSPQGSSIDITGASVNLHSGDPFHINMTYDGATLKVTLTDKTTKKALTESFTVDIPTAAGNSKAYIGFTGSTGGYTAIQNILNWTYSTN